MKLTRSELFRKLGHIGFGAGAFLIRPLGPAGGALIALAGLFFNLLLLSRLGGQALWRRGEIARGFATGLVAYPLSIVVVILVFWRRPEVAAATWGIVAFGDGLAALAAGSAIGGRLPWNPAKSWLGSALFVLAAAPSAALLVWWTSAYRYGSIFVLVAALVTALFAAWVESQPQGLDDNFTVPILTSLFLFLALASVGDWGALGSPATLSRLAVGFLISASLAVLALGMRVATRSGAAAGALLGAIIWATAGWRGFAIVALFVVLGSGATLVGYGEKREAGLAQGAGGRRSARHALAKLSVPAATAVFSLITPYSQFMRLAFAGSLAAATADTVASELGQAWGRRTVLLTTLRPVPRGTEGAVSVVGTSLGLVAALGVGASASLAGLLPGSAVFPVTLAGLMATLLESLMGATLARRGLLDNEGMNFLQSLAGALLAVGASCLLA